MRNKIPKKNLLLFFLVGFLLIGLIFVSLVGSSLKAPDPNSKETKTFVIKSGEGVTEVSNRLEKEGLIKNSNILKILIKIQGLDKKIQAGEYNLSPSMNAKEIAKTFIKGTFDVWITVPEGLRKEEIAEKLNKVLGVNKDEFINEGKEGHLFPDTYSIQKGTSVKDIVKMMEDNFNNKTSNIINKSQKGQTAEEVLILASIVEREAKNDSDRPVVAGILLKRYQNGWPLEADATTQYVVGFDENEKTWWKKNLTYYDLQIDSPFNTRKNPNLPPAPICNPGIEAIEAVVNPKDTSYWFYLSDNKGTMHYAKTIDEHNNNITKYLSL